ncbi:MAG TPA: FAD-binding oxidoreductase [Prolixibacteraceae bacterium]|nr:FAD-binding oxidoreductase [Prolixibacteraceae bacterium]HPS11784.1 FAD-binding oxidoreductase [Prolixibacteraceae bacterium]
MEKKIDEYRGEEYLFSNTVLNLEEVTNGKFMLSFKKQFGMKAGQVIALTCDRNIEPRIYSLCSGEYDSQMQIIFDLKPEGNLTPKLVNLKPGDRIFVSKPYGHFLQPEIAPKWWIATGTGIAPFRSMLRSGYPVEKLIHGARQGEHFYFEDEFKKELSDLYVRCNSGNDGSGDFSGRVSQYLEGSNTLSTDIKYYLCGRSSMVVEVRDLLIAKGVPYENIISEIFF